MTTNALNNECKNDFTVTGAASGALRKLSIQSNYNVASTSSFVEHYVAGTTADDPYSSCIIGTTASHALGIDVDDSQSLKLGYNAGAAATPSSTCFYESDTDCNNFYPLQPCMRAYVDTTQTNVTGDNTNQKVHFDVEDFDIGNNYDNSTNYQFTAPIDGRYLICTNVYLSGITSSTANGVHIYIIPSGSYWVKHVSISNSISPATELEFPVKTIMSLAANDTIHVTAQVYGSSKVVDIGAHSSSFLAIYLVG